MNFLFVKPLRYGTSIEVYKLFYISAQYMIYSVFIHYVYASKFKLKGHSNRFFSKRLRRKFLCSQLYVVPWICVRIKMSLDKGVLQWVDEVQVSPMTRCNSTTH